MKKEASKTSSQSTVPLDRRFGYRFSMLGRALGQQMLLFVEREFGLSLAEYRIVAVLENSETPSIKQIAKQSQIDKAQVTRCTSALVRKGLLKQTVDRRDRRLRSITLTRAGRALLATMRPFTNERHERLERCVTKSELEIFLYVLKRVEQEVEDMVTEQMQKSAQYRDPESRARRRRQS
ncbi:MAG: MarR family winged helix-turn-helix transcriptional regulator [Xanthobacteraceae bacterium]